MNKLKIGISLIVLIITVIIITVIAGAVILSVAQNNIIGAANEATFKSDLNTFVTDLDMYLINQLASTQGLYKAKELQANDLTVTYGSDVLQGETIKNLIPSLQQTDKYNGQFEVINGILVYKGEEELNQKWADEENILVLNGDKLDISIFTTISLPISAGTDVPCTAELSSNAEINNISLDGNLILLDENNVKIEAQPVIEIGTPTGKSTDILRSVDFIIKTDTLPIGKYKVQLKSGSVSNIYNTTNKSDVISEILFEVKDTASLDPKMALNLTIWTNKNVIVTVIYAPETAARQFSTNGVTWSAYSDPVPVTTNKTTVYARAEDAKKNNGQSSVTVTNIDKEPPSVVFETNGGTNLKTASTAVIVSDVGGSNINTGTLQYVWDSQNVNVPSTGWKTFISGETLTKSGATGTYYLWIKVSDIAGNDVLAVSNAFTLVK